MDSSLSEACEYICKIQSDILANRNILNADLDLKTFHCFWEVFVKKVFVYISNLIRYYSDQLTEVILKLCNLQLANITSNDCIIEACNEYENYIRLLFQIKLEIDYLETGLINCRGHHAEVTSTNAIMNRSIYLKDVYSKYNILVTAANGFTILKTYIRLEEQTQYSCLSLDGVRVLYTQFKTHFKIMAKQTPTDPDLMYDLENANLASLRRRTMMEINNKSNSPFCGSLVSIFSRKNSGNYPTISKITYGIVCLLL